MSSIEHEVPLFLTGWNAALKHLPAWAVLHPLQQNSYPPTPPYCSASVKCPWPVKQFRMPVAPFSARNLVRDMDQVETSWRSGSISTCRSS